VKPLDLVNLTPIMQLSKGSSEVVVGLLDGPVATNHPDLASANIRRVSEGVDGCADPDSAACMHGTFVAGVLCAERSSSAAGICPGCTVLVRPIFKETPSAEMRMPRTTPSELAEAIVECIDAGARVLNLSAALGEPSTRAERELEEALDYARSIGVIVVVAAGNQGTLGSSAITRHPWVIPIVAYDLQGRPTGETNLGSSIGRRGLRAPGESITSLGTKGKPLTWGGTSVAAPFATGATALLWSEFPAATAAEVKTAVTSAYGRRRPAVVPPLLNAWAAYEAMAKASAWQRKG